MSSDRWQVGDVSISKVVEANTLATLDEMLLGASPQTVAATTWLNPDFVEPSDPPMLRMSVQSFVVESAGQRIVIDTCFGHGKQRAYPGVAQTSGSYPDDLDAAGCPADSVDLVVATHLHYDHIGWHTRRHGDGWVATFPRARYLICGTEWEFWSQRYAEGQPAVFDSDLAYEDTLAPLWASGQVDLVEPDQLITEEVRLLPTPGHTPGHVAVWISSRGSEAAVTGDLVHTPVELVDPAWTCTSDLDAEAAADTRREFLARCHTRNALVLGTHFAAPTGGHLERAGSGWRLVSQ